MISSAPKIKLTIGACVVIALLCAIYYWFFIGIRQSIMSTSHTIFTVPSERVRKAILSNGMHVLVFKNSSLPKVLVQIAYDVGSYVEDAGERGLAHLVEHMIYKGTDKLSESDIDAIARKYGASFNAFTSLDMTSYYFETDKNNWQPFLAILADCMENTRFDPQHLASEVKAVIQELKMGKDNYWRTMMLKACELSFPPNHPYHTPTIGYKEDLLNLNAENLKRFYKKYYRPDRATLFIVGDLDMDEALQCAEKNFAHIKPDQDSIIKSFPIITPQIMTHHTRYFEDIKNTHLGFYWVIPGLRTEFPEVAVVVDALLGSGQSGRLFHELVDEKKVATSVYVKATQFMEAGVFLIFVEPLEGKENECEQLIAKALEDITQHGVTTEELEGVIKNKSRSFFQMMQDFNDFVYEWIQSYFATRQELDIFECVNHYNSVTSEQIKMFIKQHLDPFLMNRIEVLPLPAHKIEMREQIKLTSDEMDKKILDRHVRTMPVEPTRALSDYGDPAHLTFAFPKPEHVIECDNGLKILLLPTHHTPLISFNYQFKQAAFLENAYDGISVEFMMDMLLEGSERYTKKENVTFFEHHGSTYAFDKQGGRFVSLKDNFEILLNRFNHVLHQPIFPRESIEKLKAVFIDNYTRAKDSPRSVASRILRNAVYKGHPFEWTYDQAIQCIEKLDGDALKKLHEGFVTPANMIVSVVGDFEIDAMESLVKKVLGSIPQGTEVTFSSRSSEFQQASTIDHYMVRDQVMFMLGQPSPLTVYDPDLIPLKMLNIIAFRSLGSRIFKLREQTGLFYTAFGGFATQATREHGYDFVGMLVSPENIDTAERQTRQLIKEIAYGGVVQQEIEAARQIYLKDLIDLISDDSLISQLLCTLDSFNLNFDYYDRVLERVQAMTSEELNTIAKKYFSTDVMARVRVGPIGVRPKA